MKRLTIVGLGWFGLELAKTLKDKFMVSGTRRVPVQYEGIESYRLDFTPEPEGDSPDDIFNTDLLVFNIPPNSGTAGADHLYRQMLDFALKHLADSPVQKLIFISSTGVFGDHQKEVDEASDPSPSSLGGEILREAEERILAMDQFQAVVLRPAGLVGGERHPIKFLAGRQNLRGRSHPVNLVHRDDLVKLTAALIDQKLQGRVFHAVASVHPNKEAYYQKAARRLGLSPPHFNPSDESEGKVVRGEWTKSILGVKFDYDDPADMIDGIL